jgi:hypothetical protein
VKVSELKRLLDGFDDDATIVMSKDAEGNGFSPLEELNQGIYNPLSTWAGEFWHVTRLNHLPTDEELAEQGLSPRPENVELAVCFWPVN